MSLRNVFLVPVLVAASAGCSSEEATYSMTLTAQVQADGDMAAFITQNATMVDKPVTDIAGKPYFVAVFPPGFSPGNDEPLYAGWGYVSQDMGLRHEMPAVFENGAYDLIFVLYSNTEISDEVIDGNDINAAPFPIQGDVAAVDFDEAKIMPGDPEPPAGSVRVNIADADATQNLTNHQVTDINDADQVAAAFNDALMIFGSVN